MFFYIENQANKAQPSAGWSIPIETIENLPSDYRLIDILERTDGNGVLVTFPLDKGIYLYELNWNGDIERSLLIDEDISPIKVLDVGFDETSYHIYISDRNILERYIMDIDNFTVGEKTTISETAEQFSVSKDALIVGDDLLTEIIVKDQVVASFDEYNDLKRVNIFSYEEKIVATMDTVMGSNLITFDEKGLRTKELISPVQETNLGYLQDAYYDNGLITVLSSKHHIGENFPTSFGMWQLDDDLNIVNEGLWYHNRTTLRPIITNVDGNNIEYIIGVLTRQDENRQSVMEYPHLQEGTFTNILKFSRENQAIVDYERLTATRQYPIGYEFINDLETKVLAWVDRSSENTILKFAGTGQPWISTANEKYSIEYTNIISEILMTFISSIIWGLLFAAMDLLDYIFPIIIFFILVILFNKTSNFHEDKKDLYLFVIFAVAVTGFKFYLSAIGNNSLQAYGHIYPQILGSDIVLGTISVITSLCSLFLVNLWYSQNKDLSGYIHITMFVGFEVYFYIFSTMVYVVAAMSKVSLMI